MTLSPSERMKLANTIAAALRADPQLVDDVRNALHPSVSKRLSWEWKRDADSISSITMGRSYFEDHGYGY